MISSENGLLLATVLLNVQGRDVGGFVQEARDTVARAVRLPAGYYVSWSGRWENQERARARLQIVIPIVLAIIFILLYFTYKSAVEAAHVLLAVPFALTGGVYLLWLLGYNFSVAVWVGFIALFGTAVQTGVVMVIYLEEAVERKRHEFGGTLTRTALRDAVMEGALLRLRPKVMTVSTVVAGLLPIMWSTSVGAEVMKPLATPVLGGMISSLIHVLIVTPVLFFSIRERQLGLQHQPLPAAPERTSGGRRILIATVILAVWVGGSFAAWRLTRSPSDAESSAANGAVVQTVRSGDMAIVLRTPTGTLRTGRNTFTIEFRSPSGDLLDVGTVRVEANMPMPGMVMPGNVRVDPAGVPGRYTATAEFGMAGAWPISDRLEWPRGPRFRQLRGKCAMTTFRRITTFMLAAVALAMPALGQEAAQPPSAASHYVDERAGVGLDDAIARALDREPSLRAARADIDVARGLRQQAGLRPNPTVTFERRDEPAGTDNQTSVGIEWPLDLFRRSGRVQTAERGLQATQLAVTDRERLLVADVRMQYGVAAAAVRDVVVADDVVAITRRQLDLVRARVERVGRRRSSATCWSVELRRFEAERC